MPSVYLTFEQFGKTTSWTQSKIGEWSDKSKIEKGNDVWLRLYNNSCWKIKFKTDSLYLSKTTVDGKFKVIYRILEDGALANIQYDVEEQNGKQVPYGSDMANLSSLPSGKSVLFRVMKEHLSKNRSLFVDFNYGWEIKEFSNNLRPKHRSRFTAYRLELETKND